MMTWIDEELKKRILMPALSKKQQKFMGIVRSIQKGEQKRLSFPKTHKMWQKI